MSAEVVLPVGHVDAAGRIHRRAVLRKLRGHEEALLHDPRLSPPQLVTELIQACLVQLGEADADARMVRELASADRGFLVVALRRLTLGDLVRAWYRCPHCSGETAVDEDLGQIAVRRLAEGERPQPIEVELDDGYTDPDGARHTAIRLRLPRGSDEELVARSADADPLRRRDALLLRCIEAFGTLRRAVLDSIGVKILRDLTLGDRRRLYAAIERDAPGVDFRRTVTCGHCQSRFDTVLEASGFFADG